MFINGQRHWTTWILADETVDYAAVHTCVCRSALEQLAKTPQDLEQLAEAVAFQKKLVDDKARIAGRFEPLRCVHMLHEGCADLSFGSS